MHQQSRHPATLPLQCISNHDILPLSKTSFAKPSDCITVVPMKESSAKQQDPTKKAQRRLGDRREVVGGGAADPGTAQPVYSTKGAAVTRMLIEALKSNFIFSHLDEPKLLEIVRPRRAAHARGRSSPMAAHARGRSSPMPAAPSKFEWPQVSRGKCLEARVSRHVSRGTCLEARVSRHPVSLGSGPLLWDAHL